MEGFEALLKLSERLVGDDFSELMWRTGYTDFDSHQKPIANIAKFTDEALPVLRRLVEDDHLAQMVLEGIEKDRAHSTTVVRKLLCLLGAFLKISMKLPNKNTIPIILTSASLYLRLVPLSKQMAVGFSLFQKHMYLTLIEILKMINSNLASSPTNVAKYLLNTLRCFPEFINGTSMDDEECIKGTAELMCRVAYTDVAELPQFASSNSIGVLMLPETDISQLGIGCVALFCLGEMTRRYVTTESAAAAIFVAFFPFLLCVDEPKRGATLPPIIALSGRQSDLLADFFAHLCGDLHVNVDISNFIQQVIDRAPEKADYRDRAVKVAIRLARSLNSQSLDALIYWAINYGKSGRTGSRVVAIELLHGIRSLCPNESTLNKIIRHFLSRTQDVSSNVRIRALALLGDCLTSLGQSKSVTAATSASDAMVADNDTNSRSSDEAPTMPKIEVEIAVLTTAVRLADDQRVHVRRTALTLLEAVLPMIAPVCNFTAKTGPGSDVAVVFRRGFETCAQRCVDCSVLVRNQAAKTTNEVLVKTLATIPRNLIASDDLSWLGRIWVSSLLPLVADQEQRIVEKIVDLVINIAIPHVKASENMAVDQQMAWSLLNLLALKTRSFSGNYRTALTLFIKARASGTFPKLTNALKVAAETIEGDNERFKAAAWFLVGEITAALGAAQESQRALQTLERLSPGSVWLSVKQDPSTHLALTTMECILGVLAAQVSFAPNTLKNVREKLIEDLSNRLFKCAIPATLIRAAACVLFSLAHTNAEKVLSGLVEMLLNTNTKVPGEKTRRCLATLGCLGELSVGTTISKSTMGRIPQVTDVVFARITNLAQDPETEESVKAQCIFAIGQLCVADRASALRLVSVVSSFLSENASPRVPTLVQMAAVSVLADWCMWHTSVAEPYVDQMATCLRDPQPLMRRHALGVIGRLLDGNFIRWQDALFFRFITTVIDEDASIRAAATRYFETIVLPREKQFFLRKFIETMLHFNGYVGASKVGSALSQSQTQSQASQGTRLDKQLSTMALILGLSGDPNRKRRFGIYRYMIDSMGSVEERLGLARRLIDNVLLAAVREEIDIAGQTAGEAVIRDACLILSEDRMKFAKVLSNSVALADDENEAEMPGEDENADRRVEAKRAILSQAVRHVICKELLPSIISLRAYVERVKPVLLGPVCDLLVSTYTEYKAELGETLADDPDLVRELEFHMRQAQQRQRERAMMPLNKIDLTGDEEGGQVGTGKEEEHASTTQGKDIHQHNEMEVEDDAISQRSSRRGGRTESENSGPARATRKKGAAGKKPPRIDEVDEEQEEETAQPEKEREEPVAEAEVEEPSAEKRSYRGRKKQQRAVAASEDGDE